MSNCVPCDAVFVLINWACQRLAQFIKYPRFFQTNTYYLKLKARLIGQLEVTNFFAQRLAVRSALPSILRVIFTLLLILMIYKKIWLSLAAVCPSGPCKNCLQYLLGKCKGVHLRDFLFTKWTLSIINWQTWGIFLGIRGGGVLSDSPNPDPRPYFRSIPMRQM